MSSPTTPARRRPALVILDIVAAVAILVVALVLGLVLLGYVGQFGTFSSACGPGPYTGLVCSTTALGIATFGLLTVTIITFFGGLGMAIVRLLQKRLVFVWPLGALLVMVLGFWAAAYLAGATVPA